MKRDMIYLFIILALGGLIVLLLTCQDEPKTIIIKAPPDTISTTYIETVVSPPDTVIHFIARTDTITRADTIYIEAVDRYRSEKTWEDTYWTSTVRAWAPAPVDSFQLAIEVRWMDYYEHEILPNIAIECKQRWYMGRTFGFALGILTTTAILYGVSRVK